MQYLVSVIDDTAGRATPEEDAAIDVFNDRELVPHSLGDSPPPAPLYGWPGKGALFS